MFELFDSVAFPYVPLLDLDVWIALHGLDGWRVWTWTRLDAS